MIQILEKIDHERCQNALGQKMEELETTHQKYEGVGDKAYIENTLTRKFNKLCENNSIKYTLIQWRYFKEGIEDIDALRNSNLNRQQYLNIMENHISTLISECRKNLTNESKQIEDAVERKKSMVRHSKTLDARERKNEEFALIRLNSMPEDIVRYIWEFLYTPNMRFTLINSKYASELFLFKKVRLPKLKTISRCISLYIEDIGRKIYKNNNIVNSIPDQSEERFNIDILRTCRNRVRETMCKPDKIREIVNFVSRCESAIKVIEKLNYPRTTRECLAMLNKIYHLMILASKPEFNKR